MANVLNLAYKVYNELKEENCITEDLRKRLDSAPSIVLSSGLFGLTLLALKNRSDKGWNSIIIVLSRFLKEKLNEDVDEQDASKLIDKVYEISRSERSVIITREFLEYIKWLKYLVRASVGEGQ